MNIPETSQKQTEDIAIGSGYMYIKAYEKGSAIPNMAEIAVEDNRKGYLSGGASIYYTPTIDTYKDDMEEITRKILSSEDIGIKGSIGTFMVDTFDIMSPNSEITTDSTDGSANILIGGIKNYKDKYYAVVFVAADGSMSAMVIGQLEGGFTLERKKDSMTVCDLDFKATEKLDSKGHKLLINWCVGATVVTEG